MPPARPSRGSAGRPRPTARPRRPRPRPRALGHRPAVRPRVATLGARLAGARQGGSGRVLGPGAVSRQEQEEVLTWLDEVEPEADPASDQPARLARLRAWLQES